MSLDESGSNFAIVAATSLLLDVTRGSSDAYFFEYARIGYQYIRTHSDEELEDFLAYQEDSIPYEFIDMVNSQGYVRMFIERLANPFLLDDELLEEIKAAKFKHSLLNISKEDKDK